MKNNPIPGHNATQHSPRQQIPGYLIQQHASDIEKNYIFTVYLFFNHWVYRLEGGVTDIYHSLSHYIFAHAIKYHSCFLARAYMRNTLTRLLANNMCCHRSESHEHLWSSLKDPSDQYNITWLKNTSFAYTWLCEKEPTGMWKKWHPPFSRH